MSITVKPIS